MKHPFEIDYLDHVAIRVKDIDLSSIWYSEVLGLTIIKKDKWGEFPIFLMSKNFGIALFPANFNDSTLDARSKNVKIDHFAFHVSNSAFEAAQLHFKEKNIAFDFQDHDYFHSIYLSDPDGHKVELTTLVDNTFFD